MSSGEYGGTRLATLRTTKSSPGRASKITSGDTRESQQPMTMILGDCPRFREFAIAVLLGRKPAGSKRIVSFDQAGWEMRCPTGKARRGMSN